MPHVEIGLLDRYLFFAVEAVYAIATHFSTTPFSKGEPILRIAGSSLSRNLRRFSGEASSIVIRLLGVVNLAFTQRLVLARTGYDWKLEAELPLVIAGLA